MCPIFRFENKPSSGAKRQTKIKKKKFVANKSLKI